MEPASVGSGERAPSTYDLYQKDYIQEFIALHHNLLKAKEDKEQKPSGGGGTCYTATIGQVEVPLIVPPNHHDMLSQIGATWGTLTQEQKTQWSERARVKEYEIMASQPFPMVISTTTATATINRSTHCHRLLLLTTTVDCHC